MKHKLQNTGKVSLHSLYGAPVISMEAKTGDMIQYKRNGVRGMYKAKILGWLDSKPNKICLQLYTSDWSILVDKPIWVRNWGLSPIKYNGEHPLVTNAL